MREFWNKSRWFFGYAAVFAVLFAYVFWGTWSPDVSPVMPDDGIAHPLSFSEQFLGWFHGWLKSGILTPLDAFWSPLFFSKYWMQEFKYAVSLYFASLGLVWFLRGRGVSRLASCGAALFLSLCGYWCTLFSAGHGTWFILVAFIVPAFAVLDRAVTKGGLWRWMLLGTFVGWGSCFQHDLFLLFAVFLAAYGIHACVREHTFPWKGGLAAFAFFVLVGSPGIRAAFGGALAVRDRQIEESMGTALTGGKGGEAEKGKTEEEKSAAADEARWVFVTNWSMPPEDTLEFFMPRIHGDTSCPMTLQLGRAAGRDVLPYTGRLGRPLNAPSGNYRQHSLYVGRVTCLFALLAVALCLFAKGGGRATSGEESRAYAVCRSDILFFAVAAVLFWLLSMGRFCEPVYRLFYACPFGNYLRAPVKWHHLTEFCLCALAGFGMQLLSEKLVRMRVGAFAIAAGGVLLILAGAIDLARIDRLFCAPIDLRFVRGRNAAADEVIRRGKGTVCDLVEGTRGMVSWSFTAHGVGMTRDVSDKAVRFVFVGAEQVKRHEQLSKWLAARAAPVGHYVMSQAGISSADPSRSNVTLYQVGEVPPPAPPESPAADPLALSLGIASLVASVSALAGCLVVRRKS